MNLKRIFAGVCALAIFGVTINGTAQNTLQAKPEKGVKMETKKETKESPEQRANALTSRLERALGLSPTQVKSIYHINLKAENLLKNLKNSKMHEELKKSKIKEANKERNESIKAELSPEQLIKFERISNDRNGSVRGSAYKSEKMLAYIDKTVDLTPEQEKLVLATLNKYQSMMDKVSKNSPADSKETAVKIQKLRQEQKQEVKTLLTREQIAKLEAAEKEGHRGKGKDMRGNGKGNKYGHDKEMKDGAVDNTRSGRVMKDKTPKTSKTDMGNDKTVPANTNQTPKTPKTPKTSKTKLGDKTTVPAGNDVNVEKSEALENRAKLITDKLATKLGLDKAQSATILKANYNALLAIDKLGTPNESNKTEFAKIHDIRTLATTKVLTREQTAEFYKINENLMERMNFPYKKGKAKTKRKMKNNSGK